MTSARVCRNCGGGIAPGMRFCGECGMDISAEQALVTTANVPLAAGSDREDELLALLQDVTLGEYEILGELGRGGMAIVYLAHDIALDRKVAIKVMTPSIIAGAGMVERFKREARTSARLSHPHIIPIFAVKDADELLFFVMKFVSGRALDSIIEDASALPIKMIQAVLTQVGSALGYAHRNGVIHRDIKPGNIMIDEEGYAVVADFGIAKEQNAENLTQSGAAVGTPTYMSPEQCQGVELSGATDQYSLGIVAYEMITGRKPFVGETIMEIMKGHFFDPPKSIALYRPDCPASLRDVVMKMLEKEATARFDTLEDVVTAVGNVSLATNDPVRTQMIDWAKQGAELQLTARFSTPRSPSPTARPRRGLARTQKTQRAKRKGLWAGLGVALLAAGGGGGWLAFQNLGSAADPEASGTPSPLASTLDGSADSAAGVQPRPPDTTPQAPDTVTPATSTPEPLETEVTSPPPTTGSVSVANVPTNGTITMDGRVQPARFDAPPGQYPLVVRAPGFEEYTIDVTVVAGESTRITYPRRPVVVEPEPEPEPVTPATGILELRIALRGRATFANVSINGVDRGQTRGILVDTLAAGISHRISLRRDGFVPVDTTVTLTGGETRIISIQLVQR